MFRRPFEKVRLSKGSLYWESSNEEWVICWFDKPRKNNHHLVRLFLFVSIYWWRGIWSRDPKAFGFIILKEAKPPLPLDTLAPSVKSFGLSLTMMLVSVTIGNPNPTRWWSRMRPLRCWVVFLNFIPLVRDFSSCYSRY